MACHRNKCFNDCNNRGLCLPMKVLASQAGRQYDDPWDAMKIWGCMCDIGYRGPDCGQKVRLMIPSDYILCPNVFDLYRNVHRDLTH